MNQTTARWGSVMLGLALTIGTALAQQGGSSAPSTPAPPGSSTGTTSPTAPAPTAPSTPTTATPTSPAAICGLTGQGATRGGTSATASQSGSQAGATSGTTGGTGGPASAPTPPTAGSTGAASGSTPTTAPSTSTGTGTTGTGTTGGSTSGGTGGTSGSTGGAGPSTSGAATTGNTSGARLTSTDTCFAQQAALGDLFELQSSQLAARQANSAQIKSLAQQIIRDHTAASRQLSSLAPRLGLRLPTALEGPKLTELAALRNQQGVAFDRAYVTAQITAHEQAVNLFSAYSKLGNADAQLRAHATRTLPVLQRHLAAARTLLGTLAK